MSRANTTTVVSLDTFARVLGINPVHFGGAYGDDIWVLGGACSMVWPQYAWQSDDLASREELAVAIRSAEQDVAEAMGFFSGPEWIEDERVSWPHNYRRVLVSSWPHADNNNYRSAVKTRWGEIQAVGRRRVDVIEAGATVVYSDDDGDGWNEVAAITVSTSVTDPSEIKLYFAGYGGEREWEIRPVQSVTVSGGSATIKVSSWMFINPSLWERYPTQAGLEGINVSTVANYVTTADVYREYPDPALAPARIVWPGQDMNNSFVATEMQDATLTIRDKHRGFVAATPGSYDADSGLWSEAQFLYTREPTEISLWYRAGSQTRQYERGKTGDPVDSFMAETIAILALSRLPRNVCGCGNLDNRRKEYQTDYATAGGRGQFIMATNETMNCPFGTRRGEIIAWNRVARVGRNQVLGAVVI